MTRPWRIVDGTDTNEGFLDLRQRGEADFLITVGGRVLMNAAANTSEIVLAKLACARLKHRKKARVLVGGLGMGYTLKAAIDNLPAGANVVVAELNPIMLKWCRGPIAHLTGGAVDDPRVTVVIADVADIIRAAAARGGGRRFDAIILDLYEGPREGVRGRDAHLYGDAALALSRQALTAGGVLAVWSEDPDSAFEKRLAAAGFAVDRQRPGRGARHVVYIAKKAPGAPARVPGKIAAAGGGRSKKPVHGPRRGLGRTTR